MSNFTELTAMRLLRNKYKRIVNPETFELAGSGTEGEICVRSACLHKIPPQSSCSEVRLSSRGKGLVPYGG